MKERSQEPEGGKAVAEAGEPYGQQAVYLTPLVLRRDRRGRTPGGAGLHHGPRG